MLLLLLAALSLLAITLHVGRWLRERRARVRQVVRVRRAERLLGVAERKATLHLHRALIRASADEARHGSPLRSTLGWSMWIDGMRSLRKLVEGTAAEPFVQEAITAALGAP